jgi:bifunctional DNA-binding transcriptional regulator/antitoxin component of YhaV-PrlF toxin-antitoxin module
LQPHDSTDKGQTTVPHQVREALKLESRKRIQWELKEDGSVTVKPEPSALDLFGSLKSKKPFPGIEKEKAELRKRMANQAATEDVKQLSEQDGNAPVGH